MLTGVANWARTPPMLLPVEPLPCELSRSMTRTFLQPASVKCQAMLEPTMPPPMITTSAVCMSQCYTQRNLAPLLCSRSFVQGNRRADEAESQQNHGRNCWAVSSVAKNLLPRDKVCPDDERD